MLAKYKNSIKQPQTVALLVRFGANLTQSFLTLLAPRPGLKPGTCGLTGLINHCFYWFYCRQCSPKHANNRQNCHVFIHGKFLKTLRLQKNCFSYSVTYVTAWSGICSARIISGIFADLWKLDTYQILDN